MLFQGIDVIALLCVFRVMFKNTCNRDVYNSCMYNIKGREQFLIGLHDNVFLFWRLNVNDQPLFSLIQLYRTGLEAFRKKSSV